jgi:sugar transferase EpsL
MKYRVAKRGLDIVFSIIALAITGPVVGFLLLYLLVITRKSPLFVQPRVGYGEQIFSLYKIRTMYPEGVYRDRCWLKKFCRWLRQYSIDEIPQLWNVLRGDMSLVGPRPLLVEYLPLYNNYQRRRHTVKPGISGWAQVKGRNAIPWPQRFALDVWYAEHQSFQLDVQIIFYTFRHLLRPVGVRPEGLSAAEKFTGN